MAKNSVIFAVAILLLTTQMAVAQSSADSAEEVVAAHGRTLQDANADYNANCPVGWIPAQGTIYASWPMPGTVECVSYEGCKWAGMFSAMDADGQHGQCAKGAKKMSGGNGSKKACRFTPETVKSFQMASTSKKDFNRLKGKTLEVMIEGRPQVTTTVTIRDNCSDNDCRDDNCGGVYKGCCAKNSDNYKYTLIDMEANPASLLLGDDLSKEDVGGPYQANKMPLWARNYRKGLRSCISGINSMPLCYRFVKK